MTVAGKNTVTVHNVLVGEVWVCSGQSNMEFAVESRLMPGASRMLSRKLRRPIIL